MHSTKKVKFVWSFFTYTVVVVLVAPLLYIFYHSFSVNTETTHHIFSLFFKEYVYNTTIILFFSLIFLALIGFYTAYILTFYDIRYKRLFEFLVILPFAIPSYIMAYIYTDFFSYSGIIARIMRSQFDIPFLVDIMNIPGLIFIMTISFYPYMYIILKSYLKKIDRNIIDSAYSLGKNEWQIVCSLIIPLSYPAIVAGGILAIMEVLNAFGVPHYFGIRVFSTGIYTAWTSYRDLDAAVKLSFSLLIFVFILALSFSIVKNAKRYQYSTSKIKIQRVKRLSTRRAWWVYSYLIILSLVAFFIPLFYLFFWVYNTHLSLHVSLVNIVTSIGISTVSALLIVILSLVLVQFIRYNNTGFNKVLFRIVTMGYSIPGVIIAIGVLSVSISIDRLFGDQLYLTLSLIPLVLAYAIRFIMLSYNTIDSGFNKIGFSFSRAGESLGFSKWKTFVFIDVPLIKGNIIAGFLLIFIEIIKELPITGLLIPFNYETLAIAIRTYAGEERLSFTALPALIIIGISVVMLYFLTKPKKDSI